MLSNLVKAPVFGDHCSFRHVICVTGEGLSQGLSVAHIISVTLGAFPQNDTHQCSPVSDILVEVEGEHVRKGGEPLGVENGGFFLP